jgi:hypothetical protein
MESIICRGAGDVMAASYAWAIQTMLLSLVEFE